MKPGISVMMLTQDADRTLERSLESVKWADQIVIVDSGSTDSTLKIAKKYTKDIFHKKLEDFSKSRNFGKSKCVHEWVFFLDSDEYVTPELKAEIHALLQNSHGKNGFIINRAEYFLGRKLFVSTKTARICRNAPQNRYLGSVHERLEVQGTVGRLKGKLLHDSYDCIYNIIEKDQKYKEIQIREMPQLSRARVIFGMFFQPIKMFLGMMLYKGLVLKGLPGYIFSKHSAYYEFDLYTRYYELRIAGRRPVKNPYKDLNKESLKKMMAKK